MAQIKITITIEATIMRDAHAAVDAMDASLRESGGRVVKARLTRELDNRITEHWRAEVSNDEIFESVMTAMQPAEEMSGPGGAQYVALMERIAHETQGRANRMREQLKALLTVYRVNWDNGGSACGTFALTFDTFDEAEAFGNDWANECNLRDFGTTDPDGDCYTFQVIEQPDDEAIEIDDDGRKAGLNMGQP